MPDLPKPINHTVTAIMDMLAKRARPGDGDGVPMSDAVNPCDRAIWYGFRWASEPERPDGERESRFATGAHWERRLLDDLEAIGCEVERVDPETMRQRRATLANGFLRGKLDAVATGIPDAPVAVHVVEAKSHNEKSFKELVKHGVEKAKPDHYAQCQLYMHSTGIDRALYLAVNKNTDERYAERLEYDAKYAMTAEARILRIVGLAEPPPRLHEDPSAKAAFACQWCKHKAVCHEGVFARANCRTCLHSTPGPLWDCAKHDRQRDYAAQQSGCPDHRYIPGLVPGVQEDVQDGDLVVYRLRTGEQWIDGERVTA